VVGMAEGKEVAHARALGMEDSTLTANGGVLPDAQGSV